MLFCLMALTPAWVSGVTLAIDSVNGMQGGQVTVPVRALDFDNMISIQGTIDFDTAIAVFDSVDSFGLIGMNPSSFGTTLAGNGKVTFSWNDNSLQGIDLPDSAVLFALHFTVLGGPGTQTPVAPVDVPTVLEFVDTSFTPIAYTLQPGVIIIPDTLSSIDLPETAAYPVLQVHPNPVGEQSVITVKHLAGTGMTLELWSIQGQLVTQFTLLHSAMIWNGTDAQGHRLPEGLYFLRPQNGVLGETLKVYVNKQL